MEISIRRAQEQDISRIMELLSQVLEIHAAIRPDIFVPGTMKYSEEELKEILRDDDRPVYVAVGDSADLKNTVLGYCFCEMQQNPQGDFMIPFRSMYIDDLCVDQAARGLHIGQSLFEYVKKEAGNRGCYEITLNVWEGNDGPRRFYERMGLKPKKTMMEYVLKD